MISVCMATYNGEKYICEQIESILCQLSEDDELIISDDGSSDNTIGIIKEYKDNRIKLYFNNAKCYTKNFENALVHANGEYIFLADQDDIWLPNKVKITLEYLQIYDFVISDAAVISENNNVIIPSRNKKYYIRKGFINNLTKTYYLGCCMAFNRKLLNEALPFPTKSNICFHDAWISLFAEFKFNTCVIDEILIYYRRHENNVSTGGVRGKANIKRIIQIRIYLLWNILKRCLNLQFPDGDKE